MGRHREFEIDETLDAAITVFWQKGYEGASFADLVEATKVARPGLYTAFGNKEGLFLRALDRYESKYMSFMSEALDEPTAFRVIEKILRGSADVQTLEPNCHGCLGVNGALACSEEAEPIRLELIRRRRATEMALAQRLEQAKADNDLSSHSNPNLLARFVMTVAQGMAIQAKAGASREALYEIVDHTLASLPINH